MYNKLLILGLLVSNSLLSQSNFPNELLLTNNNADDRYASYSPDGSWIVFESNRHGNWQIYLMDDEGNSVEQLTQSAGDNRRPSWHPNGKSILFESGRNNVQELYTIKLKNRRVKNLPAFVNTEVPVFACYSPNGKQIAVSLQESEDRSNIAILSRKGKFIRHITNNNWRNYYPKWSSDGSEIVYFSRKDTGNADDEIYRMNIRTGSEIRLTDWHKHNFCPSWSNDGRKIVYVTSMESTRPEIYIMDRNGDNKIRVTNNEDGDTLPNWHPTENRILISGYRNGNYQICELVF